MKRALLHLAKWLGLFRLARRWTRGKLRILGYHGFAVADECEFRPGLFIRPANFRRRLEYLERTRTPVLPLGEAVERLAKGDLPACATVITVDDGFWHSLDQACRPLRKHGFPATVYMTTYYSQCPNPVFRLAVQYMFWKTSRAVVDFEGFVEIKRPSPPAPLPQAGEGSCEMQPLMQAGEGSCEMQPLVQAGEGRDGAMWEIIEYGEKHCDEPGRVRLCEQLAERLGVDYGEIARTRILSLMTADEIRQADDDGIDFQLHTHRHRFPEDPAEAQREIDDNRAFLEKIVASPREHFCYPSGVWSERHWPCLEAAGIRTAVTCDPGLNDAGTPRFALRRFLDSEDVSQIEFEAEISGFHELLRGWLSRLRRSAR